MTEEKNVLYGIRCPNCESLLFEGWMNFCKRLEKYHIKCSCCGARIKFLGREVWDNKDRRIASFPEYPAVPVNCPICDAYNSVVVMKARLNKKDYTIGWVCNKCYYSFQFPIKEVLKYKD